MPLERRTEIFGYLRVDTQVALAQTFHRGQLAAIVTEMSADDRADLFNRLAPDQQEALLPGLAQAEREDIRRLAGHAEGSAGAIMTSDYATLGLGLTMAATVSLVGVFRGGPEIAFVVALTMLLVVLAGSLIGMSLPFILDRFRLDPATASAPLVTTIADAIGVLIYFSIATTMLIA